MTAAHRRQRGFTLIELVIAMTLMGLILVIVFGGLRLAGRSWDTGSERAEKTNDMRLVENLVRRALAQAQPMMLQQDAATPKLTFSGGPRSLVFTAPLPAQAGRGGIYLMSLEVRDAGADRELILRREPFRAGLEVPDERAETTVLVEGVKQASFSYYGSENLDDAPRWTDEWQAPMRLPQLVRVRLRTDTLWPDIFAAIHNDMYSTSTGEAGTAPQPIPDNRFFQQ